MDIINRMYIMSPRDTEKFNLRMLPLHISSAVSEGVSLKIAANETTNTDQYRRRDRETK